MIDVKFFRSTDNGAPELSGSVGALIDIFDACLIDGYGSQTVTSATHVDDVVTIVTPIAHGLKPYSRQLIAGANESGYNGEFVVDIIDAYTFFYTTSGIASSPATGTITTKTDSAGWTKPYSGTNLAAYRQGAGNQHYMKITDTSTITARWLGYESMTSISAGTGDFPTNAQESGGMYIQKSNVANTDRREWIMVATDSVMYFWSWYGTTDAYGSYGLVGFGDYHSYKAGDAFNTFISGNTGATSYQYHKFAYLAAHAGAVLSSSDNGMFSARPFHQTGSSVVQGKLGDYSKANQGGMGIESSSVGLAYPSPVDGGLYMCPVTVVDGIGAANQATIRGYMKGVWNPLHSIPLSSEDIFQGNGDLVGKTFLTLRICSGGSSEGQVMLDISPSWD